MMKLGKLGRGLVLAGAALVGSAANASAAPMLFTLQGEFFGSLGASVLFTYTGTGTNSGEVEVEITNTSTSGDPRLTGFAFNMPSSVSGLNGFSSSLNGWDSLFSANSINTPGQFGFYDTAAVTNGGFLGGFPNAGIARGNTASFTFSLTGSNIGSLTESDFLSQFSYDPPRGANESEEYFIARFQRAGPFGLFSDVATPTDEPSEKPSTEIPEPTTLMLTGLGLLGLTAIRRRQA